MTEAREEEVSSPSESCPHVNVRDEKVQLTLGRFRTLTQLGYCLDCGFHVFRAVKLPPLSAWSVDPDGRERASLERSPRITVPGRHQQEGR